MRRIAGLITLIALFALSALGALIVVLGTRTALTAWSCPSPYPPHVRASPVSAYQEIKLEWSPWGICVYESTAGPAGPSGCPGPAGRIPEKLIQHRLSVAWTPRGIEIQREKEH